MAIVNLGSLFDEIAGFEESAERYYADLRDRASNDGVRLLTYYLARRKQHLPQALSLLGEYDLQKARQFPVMVSEDKVPGAAFFAAHRLDDTASADQLLSIAITFTETLLTLYKNMVEMVSTGTVHGVFRTLSVLEQRAVVELKKIRAMNYF
jgi:rubrerythrin